MKKMSAISIDLDVYKAIVQKSNYINEPANDVLRRLLLDEHTLEPSQISRSPRGDTKGLTVKGIFLKSGLRMRKHFKGKLFEAIVKDGFIEFNNRKYTSPSGAAVKAAEGSVNGWRFWDYFDERDNKWKSLETLRV